MPRIPATDRRAALVQAALRVIAAQGVAAATTRAIAAEAGMSLASVHYAFASRDELISFAVREQARAAIAALAGSETTGAAHSEHPAHVRRGRAADGSRSLGGDAVGAAERGAGSQAGDAGAAIDTAEAGLTRSGDGASAPGDGVLAAMIRAGLRGYLAHIVAGPGREQAMFELTLYALRSGLQEAAREQYAVNYAAAQEVLDAVAAQAGISWALPPADMARIVITFTDGLSLGWLADRDTAAAERVIDFAADALARLAVAP